MKQRGFTMLELLMVLALIALAYGMASPMLGKGQGTAEHKAAARSVVQALKSARNHAISERKETTVNFDLKNAAFSHAGGSQAFPKDVAVKLDTTAKELTSETSGAIRFYPDGGSTGGRVSLSRGGRTLRVDVDWLNGRIAVHEDNA
jgi:general secretion pathway protein H